jgi:hypothetical protein
MPTKKKVREKPPQSADKDSRKPEAKPPVGKFAPIIEELGKMQSKIEGKSTDKQLSLQEKLMMEIESELLKKEETVRLNFGEIFRNDPQALVELISTMRRYGDAEILRDLLFAVETLYEHKVEDIPGGKEFWDNVRTEAAPPISRPAITLADERLQRLQSIDILREAMLSYDIMSSAPESPGPDEMVEEILEPLVEDNPEDFRPAAHPEDTLPAPDIPVDWHPETPAAQQSAGPTSPETAPVSTTEAIVPVPALKSQVPVISEEELEELKKKEAEIAVALKDISGREKAIIEERTRIETLNEENRTTQVRLKADDEELARRTEELAAKEMALEEKERELRKANDEIQHKIAEHADETAHWTGRQAELQKAFEETQSMHAQTKEDLVRLRAEADSQRKSSERIKKKEETLLEAEKKLEADRRALVALRQTLEQEARRVKALEEEVNARPPSVQSVVPPELDAKVKQLEMELEAVKAELVRKEGRATADGIMVRDEMESLRTELAKRDEELAARNKAIADKESAIAAENARIRAKELELEQQRSHLIEVARQVKEREEELDRIQAEQATAAQRPPEVRTAPPATQPKPAVPAPVPPALPKTPAQVPAATPTPVKLAAGEPQPISKVRCPGCKNIIPLYTKERPLKIKCTACGKEGTLK